MATWRVLLLLIAVSGEGVLAQADASGLHRPNASPALSVQPATGKPGQLISVTASGFSCSGGSAVIELTFAGKPLGQNGGSVSCSGTVTTSFRVPDIAVGTYTLTARGYASSVETPPTEIPQPATAPSDTPTIPPATATGIPSPMATVATASIPTVPTATRTPTASATLTSTMTLIPTATFTPTLSPTAVVATVGGAPIFPLPTTPTPTSTVVPNTLIKSRPRPRPTATASPTATPCVSPVTAFFGGGAQTATPTATSVPPACSSGGVATAALLRDAQGKAFDGDEASTTFTVTSPAAPFTVVQRAHCQSRPTPGVAVLCRITEVVTNNGAHTLDFGQGVVNHLAQSVHPLTTHSGRGHLQINGQRVTWNAFQLPAGGVSSATIDVRFVPQALQAGRRVPLSNGIRAGAIDVVTRAVYVTNYGTLAARVRVLAARGVTEPIIPRTGAGGTDQRGVIRMPVGLPRTGGGGASAPLISPAAPLPQTRQRRSNLGCQSCRARTARRTSQVRGDRR